MPPIAHFFQDWGAMIQTIALVATLGVIIWYTYETRRLRKATVKENELRIRPCVIIEKVPQGLDFHNIGHSPALNVRVETLETEKFRVLFTPHNLIKHGQRVRINYTYKGQNADEEAFIQAMSSDVDFMFVPEAFTTDEFILKVCYENMENVKYYTKMRAIISQAKTEFVETNKT